MRRGSAGAAARLNEGETDLRRPMTGTEKASAATNADAMPAVLKIFMLNIVLSFHTDHYRT